MNIWQRITKLSSKENKRESFTVFLMLLPFLSLFLFCIFIPTIGVVVKSLTREKSLDFLIIFSPARLFAQNFTIENYASIFFTPYNQKLFYFTFGLAGLSTVLLILYGIGIAYYMSQTWESHERIKTLIVTIPMYTPLLVKGIGIYLLYGSGGPVNLLFDILHLQYPQVVGLWLGVLLGLTYQFSSHTIRMLVSVFRTINQDLIDASASLGASKTQTLVKVILPLTARGIVTITGFTFARLSSAFTMALIVGGGVTATPVIPLEIWRTISLAPLGLGDIPLSCALSVILILIILITQFLYVKLSGGTFKW